ncbi:MAG: DUF2264 domain-containing protein [Bullifex sp.]
MEGILVMMKSKHECRRLLLEILNPLKGLYSEGRARLRLDGGGAAYDQDTIELEAFARPLWGLVPFWAGGGSDKDFEEIYRTGMTNGSDPDHPEYWGDCHDKDQRFVEMAPIAFSLIAAPHILWEPLSDRAKDNLSAWLYQINLNELPGCNWYFFRVLVNAALKKLGRKYSEENLKDDLDYMMSCYRGEGWYIDGASGRYDYYSAFAMQYYSVLYSYLFPDDVLSKTVKERADRFFSDFLLFFSSHGEAVAYGRSQIYRFAQSAFFAAYLLIADEALYPVLKGLINRNIGYFLSKDIFTHDGIMTVGYAYPDLCMAEHYNASGSPYWSLKTFLFLILDDSSSYWTCEEAPHPSSDGKRSLTVPSFLMQRIGGDAFLYTSGMPGMKTLGHFSDKYDRFVYSSLFPFSVAISGESIEDMAPDSVLAIKVDGYIYVSKGGMRESLTDDSIAFSWSVPGVKIRTEIRLTEKGHLRIHEIESSVSCTAYDCGFAVCNDGTTVIEEENGTIKITNRDRYASVKGGKVSFIKASPNTSVAYRNSVIPCAVYEIKPGHAVLKTEFEGIRL